jgi:serine phosphatase RsbU (regulator of sigma subunit)
LEAVISVAKVGKYATSESGDTLEMVERPGGGISLVLADGQRSGKPAKAISNVVTRKALSLLADGVRDGAAARAASDYLFTYRSGKVIATLNILSIDLQSQSMVIVRNNPAPVVIADHNDLHILDEPALAVGSRRNIRPAIQEFPLRESLCAFVFTDGLTHAGDRYGEPLNIMDCVTELLETHADVPSSWAEKLLASAVEADQSRPSDDITVLVAAILPSDGDDVRRLFVRLPLP